MAEKAHIETNKLNAGHKSIGHFFPEYGDVSSMQIQAAHDEMNNLKPNLLLLALSAKKGCIWIEDNRKILCSNSLISKSSL